MASLKSFKFASVYSKLTGIYMCHEYLTGQFSTLQKREMRACGSFGRMINCCYSNAVAEKSLISKLSYQNNSESQCSSKGNMKSRLHFRKHVIRTILAKWFSTSATFNNEQAEKDCFPPGSKTIETTPKLDGPTLFECSTPQAAMRWWSTAFSERGVPKAEVSAQFIVGHALGFKQLHELTSQVLERQLAQAELDLINKLCTRRNERVPMQYIVGDWDFRDITLVVRPPVFIPRPKTEMLVDIILGHYSEEKELKLLEIGCGSGAIAVSILNELPLAHMTAVDCGDEAVKLTLENAERMGVQDRLTVHHATMTSDLPLCLQEKQGSFDAIISNPPYIPTQDMQELAPEIKLYEDLGALCGGLDGMDIIKDIIHNAQYLLKHGGSIWLETDSRHPEKIKAWLGNNREMGVRFVRTFQDNYYRPRFTQMKFQP